MALEQTRPYELDLYVEGEPGEPDISDLVILVDYVSWDRPKRYNGALSGGGSIHTESGILTGLSSRSVTVEFDSAFSETPVGWVKVYRMTEMPDGGYREQDVLWGYATSTKVTTTGFSLTINEDESLTGVIVEYDFK